MILVVGATGLVGGGICRRLAGGGTDVRALVRPTSDPGKVGRLRSVGVEVALGDLRDARSPCSSFGTWTAGSTRYGRRRSWIWRR